MWDIGTGQQIVSWSAHYSKVNKLVFTEDGSMLISAGEDAVLNVWNLADILDVSENVGFTNNHRENQ